VSEKVAFPGFGMSDCGVNNYSVHVEQKRACRGHITIVPARQDATISVKCNANGSLRRCLRR
jgi:hypothetical protein